MQRRHRALHDYDDDDHSESSDHRHIVVLGADQVSKYAQRFDIRMASGDDDDYGLTSGNDGYDKYGKKADRYENYCKRLIFVQVLVLVVLKLLSMISSAGGTGAAFAALKTKVLPAPDPSAKVTTTAAPEAAATTTDTNAASATTAENVQPEVKNTLPSFSDINNYDLIQNDNSVNDGSHKSYLLRYESSQWEKDWISFMEKLEQDNKLADDFQLKNALCKKIGDDSYNLRRYLAATCNSFHQESHWCKIADTDDYRSMYFNRQTGTVVEGKPDEVPEFAEPTQPIVILSQDSDIFSRFVYKHPDGTLSYQYIEPLVGYLRHPLYCCETFYTFGAKFKKQANPANGKCWGSLRSSRAHLVYPSSESVSRLNATLSSTSQISKLLYFDALNSKSWNTNLRYLYDAYKINTGFQFHNIHVVGHEGNEQTLVSTVPEQYRSIVQYSSIPSAQQATNQLVESTFDILSRFSTAKDYTVVKLVTPVEDGAEETSTLVEAEIDFLLNEENKHFLNPLIDEMFIEFHSYPPEKAFSPDKSLAYWYKVFLIMRKKYGIRSHTWQKEKE